MREDVLRNLAAHAASDRAFLSDLRRDPEGALAARGYDLTNDELAAVLDLRRRTAVLGNGAVAALLAGGLGGGGSPGRPGAPGGPRPPGRI